MVVEDVSRVEFLLLLLPVQVFRVAEEHAG